MILENAQTGLLDASREIGKSYSKIQRTLKQNHYKPYKLLPVQELTENQKRKRLDFCQQMLQRLDENPNLFKQILWTDESSFSTAGVFNRKNKYSWENKNHRKRAIVEIRKSGRKSIKVWCGIFQNKIVGPIFFDYTLTRETYLEMILPEIGQHLDRFSDEELNEIIWQQDGAPPHNVLEVREWLNGQFDVWIGNGGPIPWPPNSPDITPLDTFLWGFLKNKIYNNSNHSIEIIKNKIRQEIDELNQDNNNTVRNCIQNLRRRYELCVLNNGGHFEQFL